MTTNHSARGHSTAPTIATSPNDGTFAALIAVPLAVILGLWAIQTPTVAVALAAFVGGAAAAQYDAAARIAAPIARLGDEMNTDEPPDAVRRSAN